jgi:hypothetical protein
VAVYRKLGAMSRGPIAEANDFEPVGDVAADRLCLLATNKQANQKNSTMMETITGVVHKVQALKKGEFDLRDHPSLSTDLPLKIAACTKLLGAR